MVLLLRKCRDCETYTLKEICPKCGGKAASPHPAKFSMDDKYRKYKILMKRIAEKEE
ncbi:MAG: RNA-protein complex protein Nop10 [archaeon]|nr:RNA-protein complex protein Nop10 [Candidatus Bathyarchaeota archaeon]